MANAIGKKAARMLFAKHVAQMEPQDPLYEEVTDQSGRKKRVRRLEPEGLSKADLRILKKIKKRAHRMDKGFSLCGFRVGYTFFIGLIPGVGDIADAILGQMLIIGPAKKLDLPSFLVREMYTNQAISSGVGLIPILGDVILGVWKTNSRNAHLLEEYLAIRGHIYLLSQGWESDSLVAIPMKGDGSIEDPALVELYKPGHAKTPAEGIMPRSQGGSTDTGGGFFSFFKQRAQPQPQQQQQQQQQQQGVRQQQAEHQRLQAQAQAQIAQAQQRQQAQAPMQVQQQQQQQQQPSLPPRDPSMNKTPAATATSNGVRRY